MNRELDEKNAEIECLKTRSTRFEKGQDEMKENVKIYFETLNTIKNKVQSYDDQIEKYKEDNTQLTDYNKTLEHKLKEMEVEKAKLQTRQNELLFELKSIADKAANQEEKYGMKNDDLIAVHNQNEEMKLILLEQKAEIKDLNKENKKLNELLRDENRKFSGFEGEIAEVRRKFKKQEKQLERLRMEEEGFKMKNEKLLEDNTRLFTLTEQLKGHVFVLTEQNEKLVEELKLIGDQDKKMAVSLDRKSRIETMVTNNESVLQRSLIQFDAGFGGSTRGTFV